MEVTRTLARYVIESRYADIPGKVRHEAARSFLNWVGCAVGASRHETVERALAALAQFSGPAQATVLGRGERLDIISLIRGASGVVKLSSAGGHNSVIFSLPWRARHPSTAPN